jgi:hypothetical protein
MGSDNGRTGRNDINKLKILLKNRPEFDQDNYLYVNIFIKHQELITIKFKTS